ncbi:NADPH-dependent oxidoreductase [Bosea sp. 62]|nr:NADPH-dependent oxidoreductase [Bosea sp. 46]CAD5250271.1 NADPH-dependent oxidoreductase [Bosea sp. 21B]CAD5264988.1 NADPH-dependent oxidoreductase [Bosea sp. 7B]VVT44361.1 NADPH-dependent oxidoreductase [Bosea sp. EC-HK365B]VXB09621.1 NADPH-dependent oxidoreductase [Bosea sp. 29B]VXB82996.1 NADPH-dependent oxidoreductase [Bosea sp. 62]VXC31845.1 NADPH-dependent oxidoreductase [Bosea sp. 125]VXC45044.1 NADPH-dependent oxidoreductase [Bosea sp. 127]
MPLSLALTHAFLHGSPSMTAALHFADTPRSAISEASAGDDSKALLRARYRAEGQPEPAHWNEVIGQILAHRSVRSYKPDPLPDGTIETLVAAGQSAASSSNLQAWSVVAVSDPARKARLAEVTGNQKHILQAPTLLVFLADLNRLGALGAAREHAVEALDYIETLFVAIIDAALAAQNAVLAAESLGLGTVYIGALRNDPERVANELGLPPKVFPVFGLCVGYPAPEVVTGIKPRLSPALVLHREQYGAGYAPEPVAAYDGAIQGFQSEQKIPQVPWSRQALARVAGPQSLSGRDRMRDALAALGFMLR